MITRRHILASLAGLIVGGSRALAQGRVEPRPPSPIAPPLLDWDGGGTGMVSIRSDGTFVAGPGRIDTGAVRIDEAAPAPRAVECPAGHILVDDSDPIPTGDEFDGRAAVACPVCGCLFLLPAAEAGDSTEDSQ